MDANQKLLDAISAALRDAGYSNVTTAQNGSDGASITATKGAGGAYFRMIDKAKTRVALRTTAGGPEALAVPLEVSVAPAFASVSAHLTQNPAVVSAFGISSEAAALLK